MWAQTYKKCYSQKATLVTLIHLSHSILNLEEVWYNIIRNQFEIFAVKSQISKSYYKISHWLKF